MDRIILTAMNTIQLETGTILVTKRTAYWIKRGEKYLLVSSIYEYTVN